MRRKAEALSRTEPPPANPLKGQSECTIGGRRIILELTMGAMADIAAAFGTRNNFQLFARLTGEMVETKDENGVRQVVSSGPSMQDLPAIVAALSNGALTLADARQIKPADFTPTMRAVGEAVSAAFPEPNAKKNDDGTPRQTPPPTSPSTDISDSPSLT